MVLAESGRRFEEETLHMTTRTGKYLDTEYSSYSSQSSEILGVLTGTAVPADVEIGRQTVQFRGLAGKNESPSILTYTGIEKFVYDAEHGIK